MGTTPTADPCEEEVKAQVTGACSADEQAALADPATTGQKANDCGTKSFNVLTGNFNHDKFNECFTASAGISTGCSECYAVSGEYGAANCKADCLLGWCKSGCLECTKPAQADLATCTGFATPTADPCEEVSATVTVHAPLTSRLPLPIQQPLARRRTTAAPSRSTCSLATSTTTSSTSASPHLPASALVALSATLCLVSTAPQTARLTASLAGASLVALSAPSQPRLILPPALGSQPPLLIHVRRSQPP